MLKVIELFAGIGSQHQALLNIGVEHEVVGISEIDSYCIKSYEAIHGKTTNFGDICKIDKLPKADLWTYSFPCQDISVAGNLAGIKENTRSGLLYQVERLLNVANEEGTLPKYLLLENVKNLVSRRFIGDFNKWLDYLSSLGYTNYWQVLNAKDYGIPQNRERVFCVSILGEHSPFSFPDKIPLEIRLKDLLEDEVDEKYFLSQKMIDGMSRTSFNSYKLENKLIDKNGVAKTIIARYEGNPQVVEDYRKQNEELCDSLIENGKVHEGDIINHSRPNSPIVSDGNLTPTLTTRPDELGITVVDLKRGYPCEVREEQNESDQIDVIGNYSKSKFNQTSIVGKNGIAPTVTENHGQVTAIAIKNNTKQGYLLAEEGDAVDISGRMEWHRGTVQKGRSHTITTAGGDNVGVVVKDKSLYTDLEASLFTDDGNIKRYVNSEIVDEFKEGQCASTSYPNGYGRGKRTHDESISLTRSERPSVKTNLRIRKLTSRECLRLMGWKDEQIDKIQEAKISNSQQYKQAGNGIVVQVLEAIFKKMFL